MSDPLSRYNAIVKGRELPRYLRAKGISADFTSRTHEDKLWQLHRGINERSVLPLGESKAGSRRGKSLLDLKLESLGSNAQTLQFL